MSDDRTRVLVTSDTHVTRGAALPTSLLELAERADHVIHAGDFTTADVLDTLRVLAPIDAVHGNCCDADVAARLPLRAQIELAGLRIGIVHDPGPAEGRHPRLRETFAGCGLIVYGHTHAPELTWSADRAVLVCNPGSPVQRRRAPFHSAVWIEIERGAIASAELIDLDRTAP